MNRIDAIFNHLREQGQKALMPFLTAGDPDMATTARLVEAVAQVGCPICELGFAFSDPIADGPVIQESMARALAAGASATATFDMVEQVRPRVDIGIVAMVSYSIVHRWGVDRFVHRAREVGVDGFIFPDMAIEQTDAIRQRVADEGLIASFLIAPTTPLERARRIARASSGFIYLVSRSGVTGEQATLPPELPDRIAALRQETDLPIAVGFGIATAAQVAEVVSVADAAIVGSSIVRRVAGSACAGEGADEVVRAVADYTAELAAPTRQQRNQVGGTGTVRAGSAEARPVEGRGRAADG